VPCFPFGEDVAQLTTQLEQLFVVTVAQPAGSAGIVIREGDSQKICQQIAGILPKQHTGEFLPLGHTSGVVGELADCLNACLGRLFQHPLAILFGHHSLEQARLTEYGCTIGFQAKLIEANSTPSLFARN
jgi:hypothetical protein